MASEKITLVVRRPVDSGAISSLEYLERSHTLEVEFKDGQVWRYSPIEASVVGEMLEAPSIGEYFNHHIRDAARLRVRVT